MTAAPTPGRPAWTAEGTLYALLMRALPKHHTDSGILDVDKLALDLNKSREAIYKWLRSGNLTARNAAALLRLSTNIELRDFDPYVYGTD
jgi:hypothetical protein